MKAEEPAKPRKQRKWLKRIVLLILVGILCVMCLSIGYLIGFSEGNVQAQLRKQQAVAAAQAATAAGQGSQQPIPQQQQASTQGTTQVSGRNLQAPDDNCKKTILPKPAPIYQNVSYMYVGETKVNPGYEGSVFTCPIINHTSRMEPVADTVFVGTKQREQSQPPTQPAPQKTRQQAENYCRGRVPTNSSAFEACIQAYLSS